MKTEAKNGGGQQGIDVPVLFEDDNVIVINKPAGLLTHPTDDNPDEPSVASYFRTQIDDPDPIRPGIVHRLDKDTSGVMILARNIATKEFLQSQFKARTVQKSYIALVWGRLKHPRARIELPIARKPQRGNEMKIAHGGKMAISEYGVKQEFDLYSLIEIDLQTGRTHQIRVQLEHLGHPVVGDTQYGRKPMPTGLSRQFLHAKSLRCEIAKGKSKEFVAPLAPDLQSFLDNL